MQEEEEEEYIDSTELEEYEKIEIKFDRSFLFGQYRADAKPVSSVTCAGHDRTRDRDTPSKYLLEREA